MASSSGYPLDRNRPSSSEVSSSSLVSQETFQTAYSSSPDEPQASGWSTPSPLSPTSVRKAISVDSFAHTKHDLAKHSSARIRERNTIAEHTSASSSTEHMRKSENWEGSQRTPMKRKFRPGSLSGLQPAAFVSPIPGLSCDPEVYSMMTSVYEIPPKISIAVIGTRGSGKTTLIREGLKMHGLSDPAQVSMLVRSIGNLDYTFYAARMPHVPMGPTTTIGIKEIDLEDLRIEATSEALPAQALYISGVVICYDSADSRTYQHIETLLSGFKDLKLPTVLVACKSDYEPEVDPHESLAIAQDYHAGFVEVTSNHESGKERMHRCFEWIVHTIVQKQQLDLDESSSTENTVSLDEPNYPSPPAMKSSSSDIAPRLSTVISPASGSVVSHNLPRSWSGDELGFTGRISPQTSRARPLDAPSNMSDTKGPHGLRSESLERDSLQVQISSNNFLGNAPPPSRTESERDRGPSPWATLEQILDKLLFLAVSGDDPAFISQFLLTYRRFANPRSVLLAMQKRMRQLDQLLSDPLLACFAQLRICHLLGTWIQDYPYDLAVPGSAGALSAVVKSVMSKSHLLHYAADFLPFLEVLPNLVDRDIDWALKTNDLPDTSDDSYSTSDEEGLEISPVVRESPDSPPAPVRSSGLDRDRRPSLPLTAKALVMPNTPLSDGFGSDASNASTKIIIKELHKICQDLSLLDSKDIAQEITRLEVKLFLQIEPRHWLQHVFVSGRKDPETDPIARFNKVSEHLAQWVVSLILCHDRPRARSRQIERFLEIATCLRRLQNYSAVRSIIAGINKCGMDDQSMDLLKKSTSHYKVLQSYSRLFQQSGGHQAYRMALKNTKGACIPSLAVHLSDLIRTHEGNPDVSPNDTNLIHWGKFHLMGKFIRGIRQRQVQCEDEYNFPERAHIRDLLMKEYLMDENLQRIRIGEAPFDLGALDDVQSSATRPVSRDISNDPALIKKIFGFA
ncbi:ras GEF [Neolentinus lepideus HHB14362 ss-1]|uniref:Ras GEF n=1 Tax=Neolentinus lepideus HHB14362 ss-1 TaxID=1314782 RepID=A0A165Q9X5_9AGAM|nr:ras GEF [Neolentinus lepideus HHB14362 ss-1]